MRTSIDTAGNVPPRANRVINVEGADVATLQRWVVRGYTLAVLVRQ